MWSEIGDITIGLAFGFFIGYIVGYHDCFKQMIRTITTRKTP